jgi:serine O-acetyltransferase
MKPKRRKRASDRAPDTVDQLLPLFAHGQDDRPESVLASHPNSVKVVKALTALIDVMFPGKMSPGTIHYAKLDPFLRRRLNEAVRLLKPEIRKALPYRWLGESARIEGKARAVDVGRETDRVIHDFLAALPGVRRLLIEDVRAAYEGDPAALTYAEVQIAYPGVLAVVSHRLAHELYRLNVPVVPRIMSEWTHSRTGVDIHPGARIGHGFFIDHATGVVIGETTIIGNRVKLYQGVTLGARSFPLDAQGNPIKHVKRHPTVEDDVVIYANATILGGDTVIGQGATIGGNVFIMESVPPNSVVSTIHPELKIKRAGELKPDWSI